jgi:hypothetical protein
MPAIQPLSDLIGLNTSQLSQEEKTLLDADLFVRVCNELTEVFRQQNKKYFHLMKFTLEKENAMLESSFIRLIIRDILSTGEYSLQGIAYYTDIHEDVVQELAAGLNTKPLATVLWKIIELHKSVRHNLYYSIGKKIAAEYSSLHK